MSHSSSTPTKRKHQGMTNEQRAWCKNYQEQTTFEPLMDDFLHGNETFVKAAKDSIRWFEDLSADTMRQIDRIPGADDE